MTPETVKFDVLPVKVCVQPGLATLPLDSVAVMVSAAVYPEPALVIVSDDTSPVADRTAMPVALTPPPPGAENVTIGATVYCFAVCNAGTASSVKLAAVRPSTAVAVAPVPPPPLTVTVGTLE